jgi:hypothetical protein
MPHLLTFKGFRKLLGLAIFTDFSIKFPSAFGNPLIWVLSALGTSFVTALVAFRKISLNLYTLFIGAVRDNIFKLLWYEVNRFKKPQAVTPNIHYTLLL